jgi:hypothetical protein
MALLDRHGIKLPHRRWQRRLLGWALVLGGIVGFAPVAGFWMLPLGLVVLSVDSPRMRRVRRRLFVRFGRWWERNGPRSRKAHRNKKERSRS